jgi:hypothetical protein
MASCSDNGDSVTDPNPVTKGNIVGSVNLYDEGTNEVEGSGMTVILEGTSFSSTTNGDGEFTLNDVPFGTYTVVYEKSGYGTFKKFNVVHQGGNTFITQNPSLGQQSTTSITELNAGSSDDFPVILSVTTDPEGSQADSRYIRFFFSTNENVSSTNYEGVLDAFKVNITPYNLNLSIESLAALDFPVGSTVYVKCYGDSFWANNYTDPVSGREIFPNLNSNAAPAVSFVMP